jgi:hypothetical protein
MLLHTPIFRQAVLSSCLETIEVIDPFFQSVCASSKREGDLFDQN